MTKKTSVTNTPQGAAPLFSLVMCVWGVERYIEAAVASVLDQDEPDFELILVDDATPDASIERTLAVAGGDARVRVVTHAQNQGLSAARNTGLAAARGSYVSFPDPDDVLTPNYLSAAAAAIAEHGADIIFEGTLERTFNKQDVCTDERAITLPDAYAEGSAAIAKLVVPLEQATLLGYVNNKFFKRSLVAGLTFDTSLTVSEDFFFVMQALERARSIEVLDVAAYGYAKRQGSLTGGRYSPLHYQADYYPIHRKRIQTLYDYLVTHEQNTPQNLSTVGALYGRYIVSTLMRQAAPDGLSFKERLEWVRKLKQDPLYQALIPGAAAENSRVLDASLVIIRSWPAPFAVALGQATQLAKRVGPGMVSAQQSKR